MTPPPTLRRRLAAAIAVVAFVWEARAAAPPQRIVSLIPSVTEMVFAMGAGNRLVGIGTYDRFPPETSRLPRVGGLLDPDVERVLSLKPDLVVLYNTQVELKQRLDRVGVPYYAYEHRTLADITTTVRALAARIGAGDRGTRLADDMERKIAELRAAGAALPHPRTMLVIGREPSSLRNIQVSGGYGFLHDIVDAAGGDDVFSDIKRQLVQASTEMILARKPEVIIELHTEGPATATDERRQLDPWHALAAVPAVTSRRIYILTGDEFVVPGPRVIQAISELSEMLHRR